MKYEFVEVNKHFELQKGISYTSKELVENSETGLLTINAFNAGGGFKLDSEKPFGGELKPNYLLSDGDVLLAMTEQDAGLLASPLTIKSDYSKYSNLVFSLDVARVLSTSSQIDPNFLYNVLRIPAFRVRAAYGDTGSTVQRLPYEAFGELKIPSPPMNVQRAIVKIIDEIDSKIHLNKGTAETLEQIAQAIFKSWFIDFDPVHAKSLGEQPEGTDAETAALFPDSFEESELGLIPKGSKVIPLSEIAEFRNGLALQKYPAVEGEDSLPVIKIPQLKGNSVDGAGTASMQVPQKFVVDDGDILFSWSGALEVRFWAGGKGALNQHLFKVVPIVGDPWLSYFCVLQHLSWFREIAQSKATTMGHIQRGHLTEATVVVPGSQLLERAGAVIQPFIDLAVNKLVENRTLQSVRDALLPRLISGELEIPGELLVD